MTISSAQLLTIPHDMASASNQRYKPPAPNPCRKPQLKFRSSGITNNFNFLLLSPNQAECRKRNRRRTRIIAGQEGLFHLGNANSELPSTRWTPVQFASGHH